MSFLYAEDSPAQHRALAGHLLCCPACHQQIQRWRVTQQALDGWALPAPQPGRPRFLRPRFLRPFARWAAAAVVLVGIGLAFGRITSPARDLAAVQAALDAKLAAARSELLQVLDQHQSELAQALRVAATDAATSEASQLLAQYAKILEDQRDADHESYLAAFRQLDERRRTDVGTLREQLQTVALNADDGLTRAQEQLLQLAAQSFQP